MQVFLSVIFSVLQKLSAELDLKETHLLQLARHCEGLQGYSDIQQLAVALSQHMKPVQEAIHDAAEELKIRHDVLQVFGNMYQFLILLLTVFFESSNQLLDSFLSTCFHSCYMHEQLQISVFQNSSLS